MVSLFDDSMLDYVKKRQLVLLTLVTVDMKRKENYLPVSGTPEMLVQ